MTDSAAHVALPRCLSLNPDETRREPWEEVLIPLYERLRPALVGYVFRVTGSVEHAEDIVQAAFLRLFEMLRDGPGIDNPRAWLYRVTHNLAIDGARQVQTRSALLQEWETVDALPDNQSPEDAAIRRQAIANALGLLNERERHCLLLRAEGLTYQEIGDTLGISAKSVSVYLVRGLKKFGGSR